VHNTNYLADSTAHAPCGLMQQQQQGPPRKGD
jgi:hypothetical protein